MDEDLKDQALRSAVSTGVFIGALILFSLFVYHKGKQAGKWQEKMKWQAHYEEIVKPYREVK